MSLTYEVIYDEVVSRMKDAANLKNESQLARELGITPQAISNYKKSKTISGSLIVKFAKIHGLSVDWLITGKGAMLKPMGESDHGAMSSIALVMASPVLKDGKEGVKVSSIASIDPDEMILAGKLVKILRSGNKTLTEAVKLSIDTLFTTINSYNQTE